ncbi:MAG TPA: ABC transporter permease [Bryobacteraceae bacterium]|nr:ABC transporter permease [Bryobacteraceae bacterium]
MANVQRDTCYAWRQIGKNPAFSATVIITLALTVGLSTAVFSVLDAVLIRPLPYNQPDRIVALQTYAPQGYTQPASFPEYQNWRRDNQVFSAMAGYANIFGGANLETPGGPVALHSVLTTDGFFDVFGVKPMIGRGFRPGEDEPGANPVAVLSYEVWKSAFSGNPDVAGTNVQLDGRPVTVVGVMPAGFRFPINETNAIYIPLNIPKERRSMGNHWLRTVARLKAGITMAHAQSAMNALFTHYAQVYPGTKGRRVKLLDMTTFTVGNASAALRLLIYAVLVLLAIGCVNVAGLLLARGVKLEREMALRSVLGATRLALMRQILAESVIYAVIGAALGAWLAYGLISVTRMLLISALNRGADVHLNVLALGAALIIAMVTSILAGFVPALRLSKESVGMLVRSGNRIGSDRSQHRLRGGFIVAQFALALVLVVTSGLLLRALAGLRNADLGFNPDQILTTELDPSPGRYEHRNVLADFYTPMLDKVQAIPGVKAAGVIQVLPIQMWGWNSSMQIIGQPPPPPNVEHLAELRLITPGYYAAFDDKLVRGRLPDAKLDTPSSARVAVINEAFVKKFMTNGDDTIGKQFKDGDDTVTIIGLVRNVRQNIFEPPLAEFDYPISQIPPKLIPIYMPAMHLAIRTAVKPESIIGELRRVFHEVDPTLPFRTPETMSTVVAGALTFERLENWLFGTFAALAALLALVGLYGLITHEVEMSSRDIGVRMALGATRLRILAGIYRRVAFLLCGGMLIGLGITWAASRLIRSVVTVKMGHDAVAVIGLVAGLVVTGLLATYLPARKAATVDPMETLRSE